MYISCSEPVTFGKCASTVSRIYLFSGCEFPIGTTVIVPVIDVHQDIHFTSSGLHDTELFLPLFDCPDLMKLFVRLKGPEQEVHLIHTLIRVPVPAEPSFVLYFFFDLVKPALGAVIHPALVDTAYGLTRSHAADSGSIVHSSNRAIIHLYRRGRKC